MKDNLPLVTAVVVTLNNLNLLRNCLTSIYAQDYGAIEIIVVDNGSEEDIRGMLAKEFPEVRIVRLDKNHGFAGGNNRGIETAQGKYVALINNDAVAAPQWISSLVATAESDPGIGATASIIIDGNRPEVLDSCGVGIALDGMSRQAMRGMPVPNPVKPEDVLLFSGCACLLKMEALNEVGLFDEDFFAYCEGCAGRLCSSLLFHDRRKVFSAKNLLGGAKPFMGGNKEFSLVSFSHASVCYCVALSYTGILCFKGHW